MLAKIRHYVAKETLTNIYYALFHSHLTYASVVWGQISSELRNRLCTMQNKTLRIINFKGSRETADPLYKAKKIPKL